MATMYFVRITVASCVSVYFDSQHVFVRYFRTGMCINCGKNGFSWIVEASIQAKSDESTRLEQMTLTSSRGLI
jgi:hypothetical protein